MSGKYIYAIIPANEEIVFDVAGVDGSSDKVYSVPEGDIAAVVSPTRLADYRGLKREQMIRYLVSHQLVIETVMESFAVLPVKFGACLSDAAEVRRALRQGAPQFRTVLEKLAGLVQMELVVLWNLEEVLSEIGREDSMIRVKEQLGSGGAGFGIEDRITVGRIVEAALERRRAVLRHHILSSLGEMALDVIVNPGMDGNMVANVALLLDKSQRPALDHRLDTLDAKFGNRLVFRCVGPLPPYSFASAEIYSPSFEAIDDARLELGLGKSATLSEIKNAYHQLALRWHPDHNPDNPKAEVRMGALTGAYDLLTTYVQSLPPGRGGKARTACSFDRRIVEKTLLIAIRRSVPEQSPCQRSEAA